MYSYIEDRYMRTSYTTIHLKHTYTHTHTHKYLNYKLLGCKYLSNYNYTSLLAYDILFQMAICE